MSGRQGGSGRHRPGARRWIMPIGLPSPRNHNNDVVGPGLAPARPTLPSSSRVTSDGCQVIPEGWKAGVNARPGPILRSFHHARSPRVSLQVTNQRQQIIVLLHGKRLISARVEAPLPRGPRLGYPLGENPSPVTLRLVKTPQRDTLSPRERVAVPTLRGRPKGSPYMPETSGSSM